jgi:hypothetical protein
MKILIFGAWVAGPAHFLSDTGDTLKQELADVGNASGVAGGDLVGGFEDEKAAEGVVDGSHSAEVVQGPKKFGGEVGGWDISDWHGALAGRTKSDWHGALAGRTKSGVRGGRASVARTEGWVGFLPGHAATASGGIAVMATDEGINLVRHGEVLSLNSGSHTTRRRPFDSLCSLRISILAGC